MYWQIAGPAEVQAFLQDVQEHGWEAAVEHLPPGRREYWTSARRADFRSILPQRTFACALDLGCGAGAITAALAPSCGEIWGLDSCIESLRVLKLRSELCGHENIRVIHAAVTDLPFPDETFDLAVMNGVLERVGYAGSHRDVLLKQGQALSQVARCLRPGGTLYIGIENRFGANYLLGARDEHTNLRYVNVLPRAAANAYSRAVRSKEFTAFTHSYRGLRQLLVRHGFTDLQFWSPLPTYREIRLLAPLSHEPPNLAGSAAHLFPHRVPLQLAYLGKLIPRRLWKYLSPHFSVVVRKGASTS